ncbi:MAG TPA: hypothetical protein VIQ24_01125 [Pyrinomonadaceae bacterium]
MKQINVLFKRLLLACAVYAFAASVCVAQTSPEQSRQPGAPAGEKAADKTSPLDEELSKTPTGKTVAKFLAAFNSGDLKTMRAFHESFGGDQENADKDLEFYERTGGLKPHSLTTPAKDKIHVLAQTKKDARWITFQFTLDTQEPYGINSISVRPGSPPAN